MNENLLRFDRFEKCSDEGEVSKKRKYKLKYLQPEKPVMLAIKQRMINQFGCLNIVATLESSACQSLSVSAFVSRTRLQP